MTAPARKLKIALICNLKPERRDPGLPADYYSECDSVKTVEAIAGALRKRGHRVFPVEADPDLPRWFHRNPVDLVFNIAEGFEGESREARIPALLELLQIPYTGSGVLALALALDKARSKQIFRFSGIPTPNFQLFQHPDEPMDPRLKVPLIVKPNREGSAKGISASSVVQNESALRIQIRRIFDQYAQEVLVEEYIEGTELTVGILGENEILPVLEIDFSECSASGESFYSWRMKEFQGNRGLHLVPRFWCPARLSPEVTQAVQTVAWKAAKALGTRDVARVDIRLSSEGIPYVLEVNPLPGMDPKESNLPIMVRAAGISYENFINRLVTLSLDRSLRESKFRRRPRVPLPAQGKAAPSSIPLSNPNAPKSDVPTGGALPDSTAREALRPGSGQASAPPAVSAVTVQNNRSKRNGTRNRDPKEENLGR